MTEITEEPNLQNPISNEQAPPPLTQKQSLPPELEKKFNWGAFFFNWVWGAFHKYYWPLLMMFIVGGVGGALSAILLTVLEMTGTINPSWIIVISALAAIPVFGYMIWLGKRGNRIAWARVEWESIEHFKRVQKGWAIVGLIFTSVAILINVLVLSLFALGAVGGVFTKDENIGSQAESYVSQYDEEIIANYLTKEEKEWLAAEYVNFYNTVVSEDSDALVNYFVSSAEPLYKYKELFDDIGEYGYEYKNLFIDRQIQIDQEWSDIMPTPEVFQSMLETALIEKYDVSAGGESRFVYLETDVLPGKDFAWVLEFYVVPEAETVVFVM